MSNNPPQPVNEIGILAGLIVVYSLVSRRLDSTNVSAPMVFVAAGLILGGTGAVDLGFSEGDGGTFGLAVGNGVVLVVAEIALVLVLFTDASRLRLRTLRGNAAVPARLLGIGMPLSIGLGALLAFLILTDLRFWEAAILATVLAPTDAALGQAVVTSPLVPARIRQGLNVESGLNDGLSVPFLTVFIAVAGAEEIGSAGFWTRFALEQIGFGVALGVGVGLLGGYLFERSSNAGWMSGLFQQLGIASLAVVAWAAADAVGGNGFIAAFVAGIAASSAVRDLGEMVTDFTEDEGQLLNLAIFFLFGAIAAEIFDQLTWQMLLFGLLALTVVRMLPVAISLIGTGLGAKTVAYLGWFGPRGLASIILALVVFEEDASLPGAPEIFLVMTVTVLLSVFAHGITAHPLTARYARGAGRLGDDAPELADVVELPTRLGMPGGAAQPTA